MSHVCLICIIQFCCCYKPFILYLLFNSFLSKLLDKSKLISNFCSEIASHGHMDHIGAVSSHAAKRGLFGLRKAQYFVPPHLVEKLKSVTDASFAMSENTEALKDVNIIPFGKNITINVSCLKFSCKKRCCSLLVIYN